jgi:LAO/AO transport system kinase
MMPLIQDMLKGNFVALSRLITMVEDGSTGTTDIMRQIYPHSGNAYCVGITGPPGAGKSTLTGKLIGWIRKRERTVGVIACDPSSPLSGGALLGDRIRLQNHFLDEGVFIRSLPTRGKIGGLSRKVHAIARLFGAFGKDMILIETVGVGQTEVDVRDIADTTILVMTPIAGDYIQAMKAGVIEIADIFVVNKQDLGEAEVVAEDIESVLALRKKPGSWKPPVLLAQSSEDVGVAEVLSAVEKHREFLNTGDRAKKRRARKRKQEFRGIMKEMVLEQLAKSVLENKEFNEYLKKVEKGEVNPYIACEEILTGKGGWESLFMRLKNPLDNAEDE